MQPGQPDQRPPGWLAARPVLAYALFAYAWTWILAAPLLLQRRLGFALGIPDSWEAAAAFGPFVAAILVTRAVAGPDGVAAIWASLRHWRVGAGGLVLGVLSPFLLLGAALLITLAIGRGLDTSRFVASELVTVAGFLDLLIIAGLLQGLGEEPGWRGFLLPRLRERYGPLGATLALFPVWLLWHLPMFLSRPDFGLPQWFAFSAGILSAAIWLTLIWERTRSLAMAVAWHALINVARGIALAVSMPLFLTMSGLVSASALLIALAWLVAAFRRRE